LKFHFINHGKLNSLQEETEVCQQTCKHTWTDFCHTPLSSIPFICYVGQIDFVPSHRTFSKPIECSWKSFAILLKIASTSAPMTRVFKLNDVTFL
jgi:hypothetical protein